MISIDRATCKRDWPTGTSTRPPKSSMNYETRHQRLLLHHLGKGRLGIAWTMIQGTRPAVRITHRSQLNPPNVDRNHANRRRSNSQIYNLPALSDGPHQGLQTAPVSNKKKSPQNPQPGAPVRKKTSLQYHPSLFLLIQLQSTK